MHKSPINIERFVIAALVRVAILCIPGFKAIGFYLNETYGSDTPLLSQNFSLLIRSFSKLANVIQKGLQVTVKLGTSEV